MEIKSVRGVVDLAGAGGTPWWSLISLVAFLATRTFETGKRRTEKGPPRQWETEISKSVMHEWMEYTPDIIRRTRQDLRCRGGIRYDRLLKRVKNFIGFVLRRTSCPFRRCSERQRGLLWTRSHFFTSAASLICLLARRTSRPGQPLPRANSSWWIPQSRTSTESWFKL